MKLTERDKKLLWMLAYFVVIVGFAFLVFRPLLRYYMDMGDKLVLLTAQKEEMDARIAQGKDLERRRNELADLFQVSTKEFYPMLGSEEVDREITGIVTSCGMQSISLTIDMPKEGAALEWYPYAEKGQELQLPGDTAQTTTDPMDVESLTGSGESDGGEEDLDAQSSVYAPVVTVTASGSRAAAEELIDRLAKDYPAIRIRRYSRQTQRDEWEEGGASLELLSLELELYMCDKSVVLQGEEP